MLRELLISGLICASAAPSLAADRFYCAADDANIKLGLDVGFAEEAGHKLNHLRGILVAKSPQVPAEFKTLMLDSGQLTQTWSYEGELRLAMAALGGDGNASRSVQFVVMASGKTAATPMQGSYALAIDTPDKPPLQLSGHLTCSAK